jgi:hypothetical protein
MCGTFSPRAQTSGDPRPATGGAPYGITKRGQQIVANATNCAYQSGYDSGATRVTAMDPSARHAEERLLKYVATLERAVQRRAVAPSPATGGA